MIVVIPSRKGHYSNYCDILSSYHKNNVEVIVSSKKLDFILITKCVLKRENVIFLFGEQSILNATLISVLSLCTIRCTLLFYYGFSKIEESHFMIRTLAKFFFKIISKTSVKLCSLDYAYDCNVKVVNDPILLEGVIDKTYYEKTNSSTDREFKFLLPGYLDDRKCVLECLEALKVLSQRTNRPILLTLMGEIDRAIEKNIFDYVKEIGNEPNFSLVIINERFSDQSLVKNINDSDCVLAVYRDHRGSSGIVNNAIFLGKPVTFVNYGILKSVAKELAFEESTLVRSTSDNDIIDVLKYMLSCDGLNYNLDLAIKYCEKRTKMKFYEGLVCD